MILVYLCPLMILPLCNFQNWDFFGGEGQVKDEYVLGNLIQIFIPSRKFAPALTPARLEL